MKKDLSDNWAISLLGISTLVLLFIVLMLGLNRFVIHPEPQKIIVEWAIMPADSLVTKRELIVSPALIDSVQRALCLHETRVNERIDTIIEKAKQEEDDKTAVTLIVGFCVSIFAFFGYKSFKDIKKEAIEIAQKAAEEKTAEEIERKLSREIDEKFHDIYNTTMRQTIKKEILDQIPATLKQQIVEYLDSLSVEAFSSEPANNPQDLFNE